MAFLSLFVLFAADDPAETLAKKMLPIYRKEIAEYSIAVASAPKKELELQKEPVHEWTNPVREGRLVEGVVFLWLRDGRPAALGGIFSHPAPGWEGGHKILHEFLALDRDKLVVSRPNGNNQWTPQEGLERKELSDTASPAASREARLVQMRRLAKEFTARSSTTKANAWTCASCPRRCIATQRPRLEWWMARCSRLSPRRERTPKSCWSLRLAKWTARPVGNMPAADSASSVCMYSIRAKRSGPPSSTGRATSGRMTDSTFTASTRRRS